MTKKNALCLLTTGALMASMVAPAFALGGSSSSGSTTSNNSGSSSSGSSSSSTAMSVDKKLDYNTVVNMPTIDVTMTNNNSVVINPYRLAYVIDPKDPDTTDNKSVITATNLITSKSNAPLNVAVTLTSSAPDTVTWATDLIENATTPPTDRQIALDFMLQGVADADAAESATWSPDKDEADGSFGANTADATAAVSAAGATAKARDIFLDGSEQTFGVDEYYYVMAPAADADTPTYAAFKLVGDASETSGEDAWTAADKISVSTAFTFTMLPNVVTP